MNQAASIDKKILRRMKFISDQQGIMKRYLAEKSNWESHLERTRDFIISCLETSKAKSVALLGSGWLLDVPLEHLCDQFEAVYLVDILHPPQIIHRTKGIENVHLVSADLTGGGIDGAYKLVRSKQKTGEGSILDIAFQSTLKGIAPDFIISLNILNQLDILLVDYMSRFMDIPADEKEIFRTRIQQQHLDLLKPGRSCLITDVEERVLNKDGQIISTKPLAYANLPTGSLQGEWVWTFDTRGEYNPGHSTDLLVRAILL